MNNQAIVAVDAGGRNYGLAVYTPDEGVPRRLLTVATDVVDEVIAAILKAIEANEAEIVLVGYPRNLEGEPTAQTEAIDQFCEQLQEVLPAGVTLERVDETLTSHEAAENLKAEGASPSEEHAEAAKIILIDYLARQ